MSQSARKSEPEDEDVIDDLDYEVVEDKKPKRGKKPRVEAEPIKAESKSGSRKKRKQRYGKGDKAEGIAADADVDGPKPRLLRILNFIRQQDRARTGAESWFQPHEFFQFRESLLTQELQEST